jgi:hypothetical protein
VKIAEAQPLAKLRLLRICHRSISSSSSKIGT